MITTIECDNCKGTGEVEVVTEPVRGYKGGWCWPMRCNDCMGRGFHEVEIVVEAPVVTPEPAERAPVSRDVTTRLAKQHVTLATMFNPARGKFETWSLHDDRHAGLDRFWGFRETRVDAMRLHLQCIGYARNYALYNGRVEEAA